MPRTKIKAVDIAITTPVVGQFLQYNGDGELLTAVGSGGGPGTDGGANMSGFPVVAGEDLVSRDATFIEEYPTPVESIVGQNIGDVSVNTRVASIAFSSGFSGSSINLILGKTGIPTPNLEVRLVNDVAGNPGDPIADLVDPNAIGTITPASITVIGDYTINFAGSFSITRGVKVHIVMRQVGDVVNAGNYYTVYGSNKNTTTRPTKQYNGSTRPSNIPSIQDTVSYPLLGRTVYSETTSRGLRVIVNVSGLVGFEITKLPSCTATRAILYSDGGVVLATFPFAGDVANVNYTYVITTHYRIEIDNNGLSYSADYINGGFPNNTTSFNVVSQSGPGGSGGGIYAIGILSIQSLAVNQLLTSYFSYISSPTIENPLLSKTNIDFTYKTNLYGLSSTSYGAGQAAIALKDGEVNGFTGLIQGTRYFLSSTPGLLTTTDTGYFLGFAKNTTTLDVQGRKSKQLSTVLTLTGAGTNTFTYVSDGPGLLLVSGSITSIGGTMSITNSMNNQSIVWVSGTTTGSMLIPMGEGTSCTITLSSNSPAPTLTARALSFIYV